MEGSAVFDPPEPIIRSTDHDVERQIGNRVAQMPDCPPNAGGVGNRRSGDFPDDKQIHIAVRCGHAIGIGAEKDDLLGMELLDENLQVRSQLSGDPVDRIAGISEGILTDLGR